MIMDQKFANKTKQKTMRPYIKKVLEIVQQRNDSEPIFLQAVDEVLASLGPVIDEHTNIERYNILERVCEPERQHIFRVVWEDDSGKIRMNRGFRTAFNGALGPSKGGLRFHPNVNMDVIKFLAFEQVFKNSLTGLQIGGGKGGSDFDPKGKSDTEVMRFCQSFMSELFRYIGIRTDVPAGDIGVGEREIGFLFGQYKRLTNRYDLGVLTGKGVGSGGSLVRKEATGYGCVYFSREMLKRKNESLKGKIVIVSGSGNVATYAIKKLQELGAKVVACSDSTGYIYDKESIDLPALIQLKEIERKRICEYVTKRPHAQFHPSARIWNVPCEFAFPCAIQNELDINDAKTLVKNGCKMVCEGANMPSTPDAIRYFHKEGVLFAPGKAANSGGVAVSALEMEQNASWASWGFEQVDKKLQEIIKGVHDTCVYYMERYNDPYNYVTGANIGGFLRVVNAMVAHGTL